jgi:uncharacterized protein (TIGR03083 family)
LGGDVKTGVDGTVDYPAVLIEQNRLFTDTVFSVQPETPIPTCPGWSMLQLMRHVGRSQRWAAHIIGTGGDTSLDPRTVPHGRPPDETDGAQAWLLASPRSLLDAVSGIGGPHVTVATFDGPRPCQWWIRRLLHEVTVHRADAVLAVGERYELAPDLAADGIGEWLARLADMPRRGALPVADGQTVALVADDVDARWTIKGVGDRLQLSGHAAHPPVGLQLSGSATDLFLSLMRRRHAEDAGCRLEGDPALWTTFLERTPFAAPGTE